LRFRIARDTVRPSLRNHQRLNSQKKKNLFKERRNNGAILNRQYCSYFTHYGVNRRTYRYPYPNYSDPWLAEKWWRMDVLCVFRQAP